MKNILVGVDFEEESNKALDIVKNLAKCLQAKLWLVHAAAPDPDFIGYGVGPQYIRDIRAAELREEHKRLRELVDDLGKEGIEADAFLISGATVEVILEESDRLNIDMIVTAHHEHGILHKAFFGSVSMDIVRNSKVPVLVVPT